jgi:hypothetical protein
MPATTSKGFPYVLGTDNVADYPTTSQQLATLLESLVPYRIAQGQASVGSSGLATASQIITFPAGLFTVSPICFVSKTSAQQKAMPWVTPQSASQCTIGFWTSDGSNVAGAVSMAWLAIQLTPTIAMSAGVEPLLTDAELDAMEAAERAEGHDMSELIAQLRALRDMPADPIPTGFEPAGAGG